MLPLYSRDRSCVVGLDLGTIMGDLLPSVLHTNCEYSPKASKAPQTEVQQFPIIRRQGK